MSLNKGSLDKANHNQKLDIEYLYRDFIAGENITAKQIVMIDVSAVDTVLIATAANQRLGVGVALNDALSGEIVRVVIYGIVDVVAGTNIIAGNLIEVGVTAGRAYPAADFATSGGSAHTHGESLTMGDPSATVNAIERSTPTQQKYAAGTSGGSPTEIFYALEFNSLASAGSGTHNHTISGAIADESAHTHDYYGGRYIGKAIEFIANGATGKIFVCLM